MFNAANSLSPSLRGFATLVPRCSLRACRATLMPTPVRSGPPLILPSTTPTLHPPGHRVSGRPHNVQQIPVYAWLQTASSAAPCNPRGFAPHLAAPRGFYFIPVYPCVYPRRADRPILIAVKQRAFNEFFSQGPTAIVLLADKLQWIISEMKAHGACPLIASIDYSRR